MGKPTLADRVIKNTYKTLLTRGMKGCFVYFTDDETAQFFRSRMSASTASGEVGLN